MSRTATNIRTIRPWAWRMKMQAVYEITYCPICRKPWVPGFASYGLTVFRPDVRIESKP